MCREDCLILSLHHFNEHKGMEKTSKSASPVQRNLIFIPLKSFLQPFLSHSFSRRHYSVITPNKNKAARGCKKR